MYDKHVPQLLHGLTYMNNCYLKDYEQNVTFFLMILLLEMFCKWVNSWGTLREYWNVNEFLSFVIKFLSHFEFDFILIFERGSHSQRNTGSGDCPCLTHAAVALSPPLFAEGKIRVRTRLGLMAWDGGEMTCGHVECRGGQSEAARKQLRDRSPLPLRMWSVML